MKEQLENYNVLFALMAVCAMSVLWKAISYGLFHKLLWGSDGDNKKQMDEGDDVKV